MKKIIPFTKEIPFNTMIAEVTDIEVTHNLKVEDNNTIDGAFQVTGTYKMTDASQIEEKFDYDLPFTIDVDEKYDLTESQIKINDFYFEIINEDTLKINIELEIANVIEKPVRCYDDEDEQIKDEPVSNELSSVEVEDAKVLNDFDDVISSLGISTESEESTLPVNNSYESIEPVNNISNENISDIFSSINNEEDTYKSYYVYIVRENDTIDKIISKYNITKENLANYNNLDDIKIGNKLIIPCADE